MARRLSRFAIRARGWRALAYKGAYSAKCSCNWAFVFIALCLLSPASDQALLSTSAFLHVRFHSTVKLSSIVLPFQKMSTYERQDSNGWADQWDKHFDEGGPPGGRKRSKMAKVKAAATTSVGRTMSVATVSAQKVKSGTSTSLRWIKDKVQRKR